MGKCQAGCLDWVRGSDKYNGVILVMCTSIQLAAIHEAAHVVIAYLLDFSCFEVEIAESGDGGAVIDYGQHCNLAILIARKQDRVEAIRSLSGEEQEAIMAFLKMYAMTIIAGGIGEKILQGQLGSGGVEVSGDDLIRVEWVSKRYDLNLDELAVFTFDLLIEKATWAVVTDIAEQLIQKRSMGRAEVETYTKNLVK